MFLALVLAANLASPTTSDLLLNVGDDAPPFSMRDLDNKVFSLHEHAGAQAKTPSKAMVMVFFATWCKPCMKEVPVLKKVYEAWQSKGVEVIYVGLSQGAKE